MNEFVWLALCLFGAIGFVQCIGWLSSVRRRSGGAVRGYHIVTLYDNPAQIEQKLRGALSRLHWSGTCQTVLLADMGLGKESRAVCDKFIRQNPGLLLCRADALEEAIRDLDQLQGT